MKHILKEVVNERSRQDKKWGEQNHPNGTGSIIYAMTANRAKDDCDKAARRRNVTWRHILREEVYEAFAERGDKNLREELIQVMAVCAAWIECIERRK